MTLLLAICGGSDLQLCCFLATKIFFFFFWSLMHAFLGKEKIILLNFFFLKGEIICFK